LVCLDTAAKSQTLKVDKVKKKAWELTSWRCV